MVLAANLSNMVAASTAEHFLAAAKQIEIGSCISCCMVHRLMKHIAPNVLC